MKLTKKIIKDKYKLIIKKIKPILNIIINFIKKYYYILFLALPLILMDIVTRIFGRNINFYKLTKPAPNLFTLTWITLFIGIVLCFKSKIGKKLYLIINIIFIFIFLTNNVYYSLTKTFFDFNLVESASEGAPYIIDTLKNCNIWVYIFTLIIISTIYLGYKKIPSKSNNNYKHLIYVIVLFLISHSLIPLTLGKANSVLTWSSWKNPKNIYLSFNDNNKSLKIAGLYEYTFRNFYITFLKSEKAESNDDLEFLDNAFSEYGEYNNKYTGIFKGKNLIFIQLEGMDDWILNETNTKTLSNMRNNAFNFNNHYSYYNGGGSTFNSEFAVNTGFITPLSYTQNAYTFNKNSFPYSMANLFKNEGYSINAFHMNTGEYYSRTTNYKNWGYDNYYGLIDINDYPDNDKTYWLDSELIKNEKFNELLFPIDKPFVDYIITYSGHMPFTNSKGVCKLLYELDNKTNIQPEDTTNITNTANTTTEEIEPIILTEEECIKRQAQETDYMMELILNNLEEKNLIDNTVIVIFTDHYLYTIEDKTILDKYKETSNNLINKTPFFIWSKDIKKTDINKVTSQLNILPTTLNLFGINYNPNNYIGSDALNPNYDGIVFFSDYSWYDGSIYISSDNPIDTLDKNIEEKNFIISNITKKNDLALKYNYFKTKKKEDKQ